MPSVLCLFFHIFIFTVLCIIKDPVNGGGPGELMLNRLLMLCLISEVSN